MDYLTKVMSFIAIYTLIYLFALNLLIFIHTNVFNVIRGVRNLACCKNRKASDLASTNPLILTPENAEEFALKYKKRVIFDAPSKSITIQNFKITGEMQWDFDRFDQVLFTHNVFKNNNTISIKNSKSTQGKFVKNQADKNLEIVFDLKCDNPTKETATINFANNGADSLSITESPNTNIYIDNINFQGGNRIHQLKIQTKGNTLTKETQEACAKKMSYGADDIVDPPWKEDKDILNSYMRYFTELYKKSTDEKDILSIANYARQIRIIALRLSPWRDKTICFLSEFISKSGTSLVRPFFLLLFFQSYFAIITYGIFAGYDLEVGKECLENMLCNSHIEQGLGPYFALLAWFMNPVSILPNIPITTTSWLIYVLFLIQKLFTIIFYFEIIRSLWRFRSPL